jgi:hypothetical protein
MQYEDAIPVKLDAHGDPDVRYYIDHAYQMRGEAIREMVVQATAGMRRQIRHLFQLLHLRGHQPSLHH